jgi:3-deoxy-D-manno-octulosonic-acid transferase
MNGLDVCYGIAAALLAPVWRRKARGGWDERFGKVAGMLQSPAGKGDRPRLLLHAVSVGEVSALRPLVPLLTPHAQVIVATTTDTGLKRARELFGGSCEVVRYPLDFSWSVRRFLDIVRPDAVALVELEVWPNFVKACAQRSIPVGVINGRLSARSFRGYRRGRVFLRPTFARLSFAAVQDPDYAARFVAMGTPDDRVRVTGSMKWDAVDASGEIPCAGERARALGAAMGIDPGRLLVVGASTAAGEEALLLDAVRSCGVADVQLACAPRKPERFDEAAAALPGCVRRSAHGAGPGPLFLLDTIGELGLLYELADVVVIGRTFAAHGGSDPTEPAALGRATVVGPEVANFASIVSRLEAGGGVERADAASFPGVLGRLLADAGARRALAERGRAVVRSEQGASRRHAELLLAALGAGSGGVRAGDADGRSDRAAPAADGASAGVGATIAPSAQRNDALPRA